MSNELTEFEVRGRCWFRHALSETDLQNIQNGLNLSGNQSSRIDPVSLGNLKMLDPVTHIISRFMSEPKIVRAVNFNKSAQSNWTLPWHQDRVIAVNQKSPIENYENWTNKSGIWHCEPPIDILKKIIVVRIHFDPASKSNGCLEIAAGSHHHGSIPASDISGIISKSDIEICEAKRGDILVSKMLTFHRSSASETAMPRRALRLDYANIQLPEPLTWAY